MCNVCHKIINFVNNLFCVIFVLPCHSSLTILPDHSMPWFFVVIFFTSRGFNLQGVAGAYCKSFWAAYTMTAGDQLSGQVLSGDTVGRSADGLNRLPSHWHTPAPPCWTRSWQMGRTGWTRGDKEWSGPNRICKQGQKFDQASLNRINFMNRWMEK